MDVIIIQRIAAVRKMAVVLVRMDVSVLAASLAAASVVIAGAVAVRRVHRG